MTQWAWLVEPVVLALHDEQIAEHGGATGLRDPGLMQSALARPQTLLSYGAPDIADLAACYGFGLVRNHPFVDGNKRVALVVTEAFLELNGFRLTASDEDCVITVLRLAEGGLSEAEFAAWLRDRIARA